MTAAARNARENTAKARNAARKSIPRNTSLILPCNARSSSPSLNVLQQAEFNGATYETAMRSVRAKAAHAARREYEQAIFGRPATAMERAYLRHFNSYIKNVLVPECKAEGIEVKDVFNRAAEHFNTR